MKRTFSFAGLQNHITRHNNLIQGQKQHKFMWIRPSVCYLIKAKCHISIQHLMTFMIDIWYFSSEWYQWMCRSFWRTSPASEIKTICYEGRDVAHARLRGWHVLISSRCTLIMTWIFIPHTHTQSHISCLFLCLSVPLAFPMMCFSNPSCLLHIFAHSLFAAAGAKGLLSITHSVETREPTRCMKALRNGTK